MYVNNQKDKMTTISDHGEDEFEDDNLDEIVE